MPIRRSASRFFLASWLSLCAVALPGTAHADLLLEGSTLPLLTGTTVALEPQLVGVVIDSKLDTFSFAGVSGTIAGTITSRVVRAVDGTLDFYWQVTSTPNSSDDLGSFRLGNLFTPEYRVNWRSDGAGNRAPVSATRFSGAQSSDFNFNFRTVGETGALQGLGAGETSYFMFLDTSATAYDTSGLMDVADLNFARISSLFSTFAPTAATVPEPGSLALAG
ncbi:hypothetical protein WDZ92_44680, partial [Nostoc sp. NIES-2111]